MRLFRLHVTAVLLAWLMSAQWAVASNCPPPGHLLAPQQTNRLVADVTVTGMTPSLIEGQPDSAVVKVNTVFAGYAPRRIVIDSFIGGFDCGFSLAGTPIGTRLVVGVQHDYARGRYGGDWFFDYAVRVEDEDLEGYLVRPDCPANDTSCLYGSFQSMTLEEFAEVARSYAPDQYDAKPALVVDEGGEPLEIALRDGILTTKSEIALEIFSDPCSSVSPLSLRSGARKRLIELSFAFSDYSQLDITPRPPCNSVVPDIIPLGRAFEPGEYELRLYLERDQQSGGFFQPENVVGSFDISVTEPVFEFVAETPAEGSIQSGIGLIRGWACDARSVSVQFDNLPPIEMAYGTTRLDTLPVCGDANNGYGVVFAWGSLGEGSHRMQTLIDGGVVSTVEFEVSGLGEPFVKGLAGEYELDQFPQAGESVLVRWSEADQNFIVVEKRD